MNDFSQILVVEDEKKIADVISDYLRLGGFVPHIISRGDEVEAWLQSNQPALILLDLMLPGKDGIQICRDIRAGSNIPIIMVTAKIEEIDRLLGLELGADDYICKPFSPREVVARVKAVLRRHNPANRGGQVSGRFVIDTESFKATLDGQEMNLTRVEFRLLKALVDHAGKVFSRNHLLDHIYEDYRVVSDRTVDAHVKNLRKKIDAVADGDELIRSVYGVGYVLEISEKLVPVPARTLPQA